MEELHGSFEKKRTCRIVDHRIREIEGHICLTLDRLIDGILAGTPFVDHSEAEIELAVDKFIFNFYGQGVKPGEDLVKFFKVLLKMASGGGDLN